MFLFTPKLGDLPSDLEAPAQADHVIISQPREVSDQSILSDLMGNTQRRQEIVSDVVGGSAINVSERSKLRARATCLHHYHRHHHLLPLRYDDDTGPI